MIDTLRLRILLVMLSDWVNRQRGHDPRRRGRRDARARSKTRAALVQSDRKLMATTRAVLCGAVTMVRRLGQRVRTASPHARPKADLTKEDYTVEALLPHRSHKTLRCIAVWNRVRRLHDEDDGGGAHVQFGEMHNRN